ncbi:MAG TPA: nucleotide disphospho-sugar-binding domain-containing protein [Solirubrobacterales bacterium]
MSAGPIKVLIGVVGEPGHSFPAFALARALSARSHQVLILTSERWRDVVEQLGARFEPGPDRIVFPGPPPPGETAPGFAEAARGAAAVIDGFEPDVVVSDPFGTVPGVAAELAGARRATLIAQPWALYGPDRPPWSSGLALPRTPLGAMLWRGWRRIDAAAERRARVTTDRVRAELGLPPQAGPGPALSEELVLVANFPQLEFRRPRPPHVHVTGPMLFELPHPDVELPPGDAPLVLVAASTGQDPRRGLVAAALEGLAGEPVRVLASINRPGGRWEGPVPANARVVDWASYSQLMPRAAAVITRGGHGTVARSLAEGVPLLVCPAGGDMAENGGRVASSGAGLMLPGRLLGPRAVRWSVRRLLAERRYADRAREIAAWGREHDGAERGADLLEQRFG